MDAATRRHFREKFTFFISDDHPSVALAVCQICESWFGMEPDQFVTANTSSDLLRHCAAPAERSRIIILDLVMPGRLKRAALVRAVLKADPRARVVVYTADESPFLARAVMAAGAMGYVSKCSPPVELVDAIVAVSEDRKHVDARIDQKSIQTHPWVMLTESERAVMLAFCRGAKAAAIVASTGRSYSTVMTHKYNGLNKLGLRDGVDLLPYLYSHGLVFELDEEDEGEVQPI